MLVKAFPQRSARLVAIAALFVLVAPWQAARAQDDPPPQAARLSALSGDVSVQPADTQDWAQAFPNLPLGPGDRIVTNDRGRAEIQLGRTWVRIGHNADVTLVNTDQDQITFGVATGTVRVHCNGLWDEQVLYVQTPNGSTTVDQSADFRVDVMPGNSASIITDNYGPVYISGAGDFGAETGPGQALELVGSNPVYPQWLQPSYPDDLDNWSMGRDAMIARASSYRYVSPEIAGAYELDAAGDWMPESDYGPVWFPHVDAGWAPYRHGHWINRPPYGWVWVEEESWGDAPFHYGRWVTINGRWGWLPGPPAARPVWSPALVVFVGGGSPGVSAWVPLGPGEPYRPWYRCSPRYVDQVNITNITPSRRVVVQKTYVNIVNVNVTNITYVNRTAGVTAVRQEDFAAGRPVAQASASVHVDAVSMAHSQALAAPPVQPTHASAIAPPPPHPVQAVIARPVLINAKGQAVAAAPHAQPVAAPVHQVAAPKPLPGRTAVAQPPSVRIIPPSQHLTPAGKPVASPVAAKPVPNPAPAPKPAPIPAVQPKPAPAPAPMPAPAQHQPAPAPAPTPQVQPKPAPAQPSQSNPAPATRPTPQVQPKPAPAPVLKPTPPPPPPPRPAPAVQPPPKAQPTQPAPKPNDKKPKKPGDNSKPD